MRIVVVGAGVVGMSCARQLARFHDVHIFADEFGIETASVKATAIWHVYLVEETATVLDMAAATLATFYDLMEGPEDRGLGVVRGVELFRTQPPTLPTWFRIPRHFRILADDEVDSFNVITGRRLTEFERETLERFPVTWGYEVEAPVANMERYLPWLQRETRSLGVTFTKGRIEDLNALDSRFELIINCSGAGSRLLCDDNDVLPVKGQYFVLGPIGGIPDTYVGDDDNPLGMSYVIPRLGEVMVGGTAEFGVVSETFDLQFSELQRRAALYAPWLALCEPSSIRRSVTGIRPYRTAGLRLELDLSGQRPIIHNYGHGGSGFSLSWGTANAVVNMVSTL